MTGENANLDNSDFGIGGSELEETYNTLSKPPVLSAITMKAPFGSVQLFSQLTRWLVISPI